MTFKKILFTSIIGVFISTFFLYYSFKNIPTHQIYTTLIQINYIWIIPSTLLVILAFFFRALRWKYILHTEKKISIMDVYHPLVIGFMMNCVMPARIGEIARPLILKQSANVAFSKGLGSVMIERLFDLLFMIICLSLIIGIISVDNGLNYQFGGYSLNKDTLITIHNNMIILSILLILFTFVIVLERPRSWIKKMVSILPEKISELFIATIDNLASIFKLIQNIKIIIPCIALSTIIWVLHGLSYYIMTFAFNGLSLTFSDVFFYMIIICFFITLPSVPGFWGLWEAGGLFALMLLGVADDVGAGFTLINHTIQIIPVILLGFFSFILKGMKFKDIQKIIKIDKSDVTKD